ncbi:glycosyltransferase [Candidatus Gracilibacteria bacterium]|nr:glycosyltransferase [Candidatus Gracilibacteria bacterium]
MEGSLAPKKRIAIITDWLTDRGGAEHVIIALTEAFPEATIFTSVFNREAFPELENRDVRTTFLQYLPAFLRRRHQFLLPFFPKAFESLDLLEYDIIISSSSSGFSKCARKQKEGSIHICYCHTPVRFLYHAREEYLNDYPLPWWAFPLKPLLPYLLDYLTRKDQLASQKVDWFIANSNFVGERIQTYYDQKPITIYPCVDTEPFVAAGKTIAQTQSLEKSQSYSLGERDYFLAVGRFIPYKKFDLLIEVFSANKLPLKLVGSGPSFEQCRQMAFELRASNIEFFGFVPRYKLPDFFAKARAFLFPVEEDFGLTPIEAMSAGTPVIYFNRGGATESVGEWGIPFDAQTVESVQKGIDEFLKRETTFNSQKLQERGLMFDKKVFIEKIKKFIFSLPSRS